jgi:hypothetical protein
MRFQRLTPPKTPRPAGNPNVGPATLRVGTHGARECLDRADPTAGTAGSFPSLQLGGGRGKGLSVTAPTSRPAGGVRQSAGPLGGPPLLRALQRALA